MPVMMESRLIIINVLINYPGGNSLISEGRGKGGVWNYYETLRGYFDEDIEYFSIGSRDSSGKTFRMVWRMFKDYLHFYRKLKYGKYDLIHLNPSLNSKAVIRDGLFLIIAKLMRQRVLVFVRGWDSSFEKVISKHFLFLFRRIYFRADAFIVLAKNFSNTLQSWGYNGPVYIETTVVSDDLIESCVNHIKRDFDKRSMNILFLSSIEKDKGIYEALNAFFIVKEKFPHLKMIVAGIGTELEKAIEYVCSKGVNGISFIGWVEGESKNKAFFDADIYLFPSHHGEGMPNSVLEAMGCSLPIITRAVGGLSDFFENGKMGFITESTDPDVFAEFIEQLIDSPELCKRIAEYNHDYASRRFAASQVVGRLNQIYIEVGAHAACQPMVT
jgi:glycosyltransferase involved in cell wall biosynthesis